MAIVNTFDLLLEEREVPPMIQQKMNQLEQSKYFPYFDTAGHQALWSIIIYAIDNGWSEEQIDRLLFSPVKPDASHIDIFRKRHQQIYKEQAVGLAELVDNPLEQFFAITSSMYAGKSTLAAEVSNQLEQKGYRVITMVPHFMGDFITIRGSEPTEEDIVGEDGFTRINAIPYNHDNYQAIIENFGINKTDKVVIHFDEFSFLPAECILEFIQFITVNYSNVKVLFVGLDKNALGQELDGYTAIKESVSEEFACRSFVPDSIDVVDESTEPTGTYTARYVVLPDGFTVLDCGFLPVVVPKEYAELVYYTPTEKQRHMNTILKNMEHHQLLNAIVNPHIMQQKIRNNLFEGLKTEIAAKTILEA